MAKTANMPRKRARATQFGYDAADTTGTSRRRRYATTQLQSEDDILTKEKRKKLVSTQRDLYRNFSIAAWMVRKHLDYVSSFTFQSRTGDPALDNRIEELMEWYGREENCDVARRHPLPQIIRLAEACRTIDGDVFLLKLNSGHLQAIESDRVRQPRNTNVVNPDDYPHGIKTKPSGMIDSYAINGRAKGSIGYVFDRKIAAKNVLPLGYYGRFDQIRGISPLSTAVNTLVDVYEGFDYALAKAKVAQMFGLVFYRDSEEPPAEIATETDGETEDETSRYKVDFGKGPILLDLDPGDKAEFLENKTPSAEFRDFSQVMIVVALKSLDIPYSFYDESFTNFYGSRGAMNQYIKSCKSKRDDLANLLRKLTAWRLSLFILDGVLELPRAMTMEDLKYEWIPTGVPWWDTKKEADGELALIQSGLKTRSQVLKERDGGDFRDVIDKLAEEEEYMRGKNIAVILPGAKAEQPMQEVQQ